MIDNSGLLYVSERLEKEKEILEEKADRRVEILKDLISKMVSLSSNNPNEKKVTFILKKKSTEQSEVTLGDYCHLITL